MSRNQGRRISCTLPGAIGPVENKLASVDRVEAIVFGAFREASEATHSLICHLATSRVSVAGPQKERRRKLREEHAEIAQATAFLRRTLSVAGVKAQAFSLLG